MNVKMFGHRCLVEFHRLKSKSNILIPDNAQQTDTHRLGIVRFVGDGRVKGKDETVPSLVKPGDLVMFQINNIMLATQQFVLNGKTCMNLLQDELIARIDGEDQSYENLTMLGDYVLLKHFERRQPGSTLFVPESVMRNSAPDFIYFRCQKKGSTSGEHFKEGDELVVNFGRLTPMFISTDGKNDEYCYTRKEWIDGVVEGTEEVDADAQQN